MESERRAAHPCWPGHLATSHRSFHGRRPCRERGPCHAHEQAPGYASLQAAEVESAAEAESVQKIMRLLTGFRVVLALLFVGLFLDLVYDLIRDAQVLDRVSTDVSLRHAPEAITILCAQL